MALSYRHLDYLFEANSHSPSWLFLFSAMGRMSSL